jgi:hypothetical protein
MQAEQDDDNDNRNDTVDQQLQLQPVASNQSSSAESMRVRLAIFLRLQAQRAELLTAARGIVPMLSSLRTELHQWMHANAVDVLTYTWPLHGEVRCVERKVKRRANVDDVLALVALEYGEAARERLQQQLKALAEQSVETKRDVRITFKRGAEFARERHQAVIEEFVPNHVRD